MSPRNSASIIALLFGMTAGSAYAQDAQTMETVVVTGIRASERKAVELKRGASGIQDSIVAEDIGKLPDTTIADSLQRITGVQIDRSSGGEGGGVNIRGLPEVGSLLNGEVFLSSSSITGVQPNYGDIPSQLFGGADVIKSATANLLNAGITGTINLKTRRPSDLNDGWTVTVSGDTVHGSTSNSWDPEVNGLVAYNGGRWGILISGTYSDVTEANNYNGGGTLALEGENSAAATNADSRGFLSGYGYSNYPIPSAVHILNPAACTRNANGTFPYQATGCDVDVDGDGHATHAYTFFQDWDADVDMVERTRQGFNASVQGELGSGLRATMDFFYTNMVANERDQMFDYSNVNWQAATFVPTVGHDTGVAAPAGWENSTGELFWTEAATKYGGQTQMTANNTLSKTQSRNWNFQLDYDNGGNFTGDVRAIYADAASFNTKGYINFYVNDGSQWNHQPSLVPAGTDIFPAVMPVSGIPGGNRVYNALGLAPAATSMAADFRGSAVQYKPSDNLAAVMANENAWGIGTLSDDWANQSKSDMLVLRADGHYTFGESGVRFDFGVRTSQRTVDHEGFQEVYPVWGGHGAYSQDASGNYVANSTGCYVKWIASDMQMNAGSCIAGNGTTPASDAANGYYIANYYAGMNASTLPAVFGKNFKYYKNMAGTGINAWGLNPKVLDDPIAFINSLYPGGVRSDNPNDTYHVSLDQRSAYVQANIAGTTDLPEGLAFPYSLSAGVKVIETDLRVSNYSNGSGLPYGMSALPGPAIKTNTTFTDVLPAVNLSVDLKDDLKLRMAYAKNMQLLDLSQWGGGFSVGYSIDSATGIFHVSSANEAGSPNLLPWRSDNYDMSLEYYLGANSMVNLELFYIDVASFIKGGSFQRCDLPDLDGVVRSCITVTGPVQGKGAALRGAEAGWKQGFDFLPGLLANTGMELNFTYSPSNVGKDMLGHSYGFQDNSRYQSNMVLWYQDDTLELRVAGNYRSKIAVADNFGGVSGAEEYQASTFYLDASATYNITSKLQGYVQGSNLLGEGKRFYINQAYAVVGNNAFEPRITMGVRAKF